MAQERDQRATAKAKAAAANAKTCAICGKPRDPRYEPFCSKHCADIDLHHWLSGAYVVPGGPATPDAPEGEED